MSTRGTYLFERNDDLINDTCLYNHHDNYPEGAVHLIWKAFKCGGRITPENFIRANDRMEITRDHELHGDTEYRYTFKGTNLVVLERGTGEYHSEWNTHFTGPWWEFVTKYAENEHYPIEDFEPIELVQFRFGDPEPMTKSMITERLNKEARLLGLWATNGNDKGANWDHLVELVKLLRSKGG